MKVSTEIDNNFGDEKITQLVDNIPLNTKCKRPKTIVIRIIVRMTIFKSIHMAFYANTSRACALFRNNKQHVVLGQKRNCQHFMKVSTEIDNNFGDEKITQLVDNIPLNTKCKYKRKNAKMPRQCKFKRKNAFCIIKEQLVSSMRTV
jgi:hypothetical protein